MKKILIILNSLFLALAFTACEKDGITDRSVDFDGDPRFSFVNLSTGSPEVNLYFNGTRVTAARSQTAKVLRGIPYRSSYPGIVTATVAATTLPTSYLGEEYFTKESGNYTVTAKDTAYRAGYKTYATTSNIFQDGKYYSIYTMNPAATMEFIVVEDDIVEFQDTVYTKVRAVNAISGVPGGAVDIWLVHQPGTTSLAIQPYKMASNLAYKAVTEFCDTISGANYKWYVTIAGTVPTITNPTAPYGKPYTLAFPAGTTLYARDATTLGISQTYSLLSFGEYGGATVKAPFSGVYRNRYH